MKFFLTLTLLSASIVAGSGYSLVVSKSTLESKEWKLVVDVLKKKHQAELFVFEKNVGDSLKSLREQFPAFTCFVAKPGEVTKEF
ncbi:MAG: hypothetical protein HOK49_13310, partial [Opitutae bacterium]|nr:hypothetical protein [Opitutae bacterium]